jgi:transposase
MKSYSDWERDELHARVRGMYREGATLEQIAASTGYSDRHVCRLVRKAGLESRLGPTLRNPERRLRVVKLGQAGVSISGIQQRCGGHTSSIRAVLMAAGVPIRRPGRPSSPWGAYNHGRSACAT